VNLWRKLKKFGAIQLKTSAYVLPDAPLHYERFQWLAGQIRDLNGEATLIRVAEIEGMPQEQIVQSFNDARAAEYRELMAACRDGLARRHKARGAALVGDLEKLHRRFNEIREVDYFNCPTATDAQMLLQRADRLVSRQQPGRHPPRLDRAKYVGKTWLTRPRPGIDRVGSAWLIRKFIDAKAAFVFGMDFRKHPGALPFDMADVEFSHHGDDCTFETLVSRFGINDPAALKIAEMVHDADLEDGKFQRNECLGINAVLLGWARAGMSDADLLVKGGQCFEGLYAQLRK